jgi:predicted protein tyrosine phosphatase
MPTSHASDEIGGDPVVAPALFVCPLSKVPTLVTRHGASHVVTLIREHDAIPTPQGIDPANHLRIGINDIVMAQDGLIHPVDTHIETLLGFVRAWPGAAPIIIHCWAGISRSTAAAFITQCALNPDASELHLARALRKASPTATPNALMVDIADRMLARRGRMLDAIASIGVGETAMEGVPFQLPAKVP